MAKETDIPQQSFIPSSHDMNLNTDYTSWLNGLKDRYQKSQIKAAIKVNSENSFGTGNWDET